MSELGEITAAVRVDGLRRLLLPAEKDTYLWEPEAESAEVGVGVEL